MKRVSLCRSADCAQSPLPFSFAWHHAGVSRSESYPNIVLTDIRLGKSIPCSVQLLQMEGQKSATRSSGSERTCTFAKMQIFGSASLPLPPLLATCAQRRRRSPPIRAGRPRRDLAPPFLVSSLSLQRREEASLLGLLVTIVLSSPARSRACHFRVGRGNCRRDLAPVASERGGETAGARAVAAPGGAAGRAPLSTPRRSRLSSGGPGDQPRTAAEQLLVTA